MLVAVSAAIVFYCLLMSSHTTRTNPDVSQGVAVELANYERNESNEHHSVIGIIVEEHRYNEFVKALNILQSKQVMTNVTIVYRVVKNDPYVVLKTVCDNFTNVHGLVFVCERPCSGISSFVSFIGLSGMLVEKRSEDHTSLFMVCFCNYNRGRRNHTI